MQKKEITLNNITNKEGNSPCFPKGCEQGCDCELKAVQTADKIIPNSFLSETLYKNLYDENIVNKVTNFIEVSSIYDTEYISKSIKNIEFSRRNYDITFACFNWKRKLKGMELIDKISTDKRLMTYKILIIGGSSSLSKNKNITIKECCPNNELLNYFANSKCFVCTSYYDSYPNVINEANYCGCNIVTSTNVGQCRVLPQESIVKNFYDATEWVNKILYSINFKRPTFTINQPDVLNKLNKYIM